MKKTPVQEARERVDRFLSTISQLKHWPADRRHLDELIDELEEAAREDGKECMREP